MCDRSPSAASDVPSSTDDLPASSVAKALSLLDAFETVGMSLGVTELARRTNLPKSTAFRLLAILEEFSLIERNGTRYMLGKRLFELGNRTSICRPSALREVARPYLVELCEHTHETVHLAVLDGTDVLYLEKIHGHRKVRAPSTVGGRIPAYCCAIGKAMLSRSTAEVTQRVIGAGLAPITGYTISNPALFAQDLETARNQGVAFDREESSVGVTCVAAPIVTAAGALVGAVSVAGQVGRFDPARHANLVARTARSIGESVFA